MGTPHRKTEKEEMELVAFRSDFSQCDLAGCACICEHTEEVEMQQSLRNCPFPAAFPLLPLPNLPWGFLHTSPYHHILESGSGWDKPHGQCHIIHICSPMAMGARTLQMKPPFLSEGLCCQKRCQNLHHRACHQ